MYEYRCTQCGNRYEKIQKVSDAPDTECPKCGGKVERPLTAPALQFKGSGWYINDYAAKPAGGSGSAGSNEAKSSETKSSETKTESKPAESKPAASESKPTSGGSST